MADLRFQPGPLNLFLYRGDDRSFTLVLKDKTTGDPLVLPTTGWSAQVRLKATNSTNSEDYQVLMTFDVDATDAANGRLVISWSGADVDTLPKGKCRWDLQNDGTDVVTYVAGDVTALDQVTR